MITIGNRVKGNQIFRFLQAFDRFLDQNEHWLQRPERQMYDLEANMEYWEAHFTQQIWIVEESIKKIEQKLEDS
ncbi:hypothetical protein [Salirhabdus salicampi]|uniref:hypothetical protein n=1 Tax=Salirhabdus salicampi TaxID=476102 RepID=UPI0020C49859|nr:hypothetical protein [Salirhabdus salicampi]MCP8615605.1 hypothetical protein [Salirhabdus salicampi]